MVLINTVYKQQDIAGSKLTSVMWLVPGFKPGNYFSPLAYPLHFSHLCLLVGIDRNMNKGTGKMGTLYLRSYLSVGLTYRCVFVYNVHIIQ